MYIYITYVIYINLKQLREAAMLAFSFALLFFNFVVVLLDYATSFSRPGIITKKSLELKNDSRKKSSNSKRYTFLTRFLVKSDRMQMNM